MNSVSTRAAALLRLGERLGAPPEGMMAFGDTFNDAEKAEGGKVRFPCRERRPPG